MLTGRAYGPCCAGLALLAGVACLAGSAFVCSEDADCIQAGARGTCEATSYCSFPDEACDGGRRYGENAGDFAGTCVGDSGGSTSMAGSGGTTLATGTSSGASSTTATDSSSTTEDDTGIESGPNLVFVSSTAVPAENIGGISGANQTCNDLAAAAGIDGTYVAWLSTSTVDAIDALQGSRGWVRLDGRPFADTVADIAAGNVWYPPMLDETGTPHAVDVATGTLQNGTADGPNQLCNDWNQGNGSGRGGLSDAAAELWTQDNGFSCNSDVHLYCFGVGRDEQVGTVPVMGRRAFVTTSPVVASAGLAGFDARCQSDAAAAGLAGEFLAFVAVNSQSPASRYELGAPTWTLQSGLPLLDAATDLTTATAFLVAPFENADGTRPTSALSVFTGTASFATADGPDCTAWTLATGSAAVGAPHRAITFGTTTTSCALGRRVLCLQR